MTARGALGRQKEQGRPTVILPALGENDGGAR